MSQTVSPYVVIVRGTPHDFTSLEHAAVFAAARKLEGETDIAYSAPGFADELRTIHDAALVHRVEELLSQHGKTL